MIVMYVLFFPAVDGILYAHSLLVFRRVLFRSPRRAHCRTGRARTATSGGAAARRSSRSMPPSPSSSPASDRLRARRLAEQHPAVDVEVRLQHEDAVHVHGMQVLLRKLDRIAGGKAADRKSTRLNSSH